MVTNEQLQGVFDIVKGILGVRSQNAQIMLSGNGLIVFRIDHSMLYVIPTDLFYLEQDMYIWYNTEMIVPLDDNTARDLIMVYNNCTKPLPLLVKMDNLEEDPVFMEYASLKSKDGIRYYEVFDDNHNAYRIPMFVGFVKFTKTDKADIEIYDYDMGPYYMNKYIVKKKKINYPIYVYFMTLKLS